MTPARFATFGLAVLGLLIGACSSDDENHFGGGAGAAGSSAGKAAFAGTSNGGGAGGSSNAGGATNGGLSGTAGSSLAGSGGAAGSEPASGGMAGGVNGGSPGSAGTTSGAAGATAGSGAAGGGAGTASVGSATFSIDARLASEVDADAPGTIGIVTWSVDVSPLSAARIEFGLDTTYGMSAPVDLAAADHRTLLLGMKPARTYHFRIVAESGGVTYASDDNELETGPPTDLVPLEDFRVIDDAARERGFIVTSYWQGDGSSVPFILDADGEIVWWYTGGMNGIARAVMSADGKNLWMIAASNNGGALRRVSMDTLDAQTYDDTVGSHDITPVSGELMAFLEYGESDCDSIYEIDPSGATEEVFESQGVVQASGCHANALRYSQAEDVYTLSDVSQDVFVIGRDGSVQWRLSERVEMGNDAWGGTQHGHHLLAGSMVVFANRGGGNMVSSVVEYTLAGELLLEYESGDFSQNLGDVQRLPGGNTLVTFSNASLIHEIDPEGNAVLEIDGGGSRFGYSLWRPTLYGPPPDISD